MPTTIEERVRAIADFHARVLGRPLTVVELLTGLPEPLRAAAFGVVHTIAAEREYLGFIGATGVAAVERRIDQDILCDDLWRRFLRHAWVFRYAPFVEAAFVGGSLALGNVTPKSDVDLLIVVRPGRLFTARYALIALAAIAGLHRKNDDRTSSPGAFCMNHFVTPETWSKPPHNLYRRELYRRLVPVWGKRETVRAFIAANDWCGRNANETNDIRWRGGESSFLRRVAEAVLGGGCGGLVERRLLQPFALRRLRRYAAEHARGQRGRVMLSGSELEFHFSVPYEEAAPGSLTT